MAWLNIKSFKYVFRNKKLASETELFLCSDGTVSGSFPLKTYRGDSVGFLQTPSISHVIESGISWGK